MLRYLLLALVIAGVASAAQQTVDIGSVADDGTGDPARTAFDKLNDNDTELYSRTAALATVTDDRVYVANGASIDAKALTDCDDTGGNHLNYDTGTNVFSCGTSAAGGFTYESGVLQRTATGCDTTPSMDVAYTRVGNMVTLTLVEAVACTSNSSNGVAIDTALPSSLRPAQTLRVKGVAATNSNSAVEGCITVTSAGALSITNNFTATTNCGGSYTASGTKGYSLNTSSSITYNIQIM